MRIALTPSAFAGTLPLALSLITLRSAVIPTRDWTSWTGCRHDRLFFFYRVLCHRQGDITSGAVKKWVCISGSVTTKYDVTQDCGVAAREGAVLYSFTPIGNDMSAYLY
jgi:hypothetical protein